MCNLKQPKKIPIDILIHQHRAKFTKNYANPPKKKYSRIYAIIK